MASAAPNDLGLLVSIMHSSPRDEWATLAHSVRALRPAFSSLAIDVCRSHRLWRDIYDDTRRRLEALSVKETWCESYAARWEYTTCPLLGADEGTLMLQFKE